MRESRLRTSCLLLFVAHALVASAPARAQEPIPYEEQREADSQEVYDWTEIPCDAEDGRTVRGVIRDTRDESVFGAIIFPDHRCGAEATDGTYIARNVPRSVTRLWFAILGYGWFEHRVVTSRDTVIDHVVEAIPGRIRDWAAYPGRPPAPEHVVGVAGCYWMGHDLIGYDRTFQLLPGGDVEASGQLIEDGWAMLEDERGVKVTFLSGIFAWTSITMDLGEDPIDWSALPSIFVSRSDARMFATSQWESFVSRVDCPTGDS